ncbi:hypothetical protein ACFE04_000349 [Oxalis oulophora]
MVVEEYYKSMRNIANIKQHELSIVNAIITVNFNRCFFSIAVGEIRSFENPKHKITAVPAKEEDIWGATFKDKLYILFRIGSSSRTCCLFVVTCYVELQSTWLLSLTNIDPMKNAHICCFNHTDSFQHHTAEHHTAEQGKEVAATQDLLYNSGTEKKFASKFLRPGSLQIAAGLAGKGSRGNIIKNFSRLATIGRGTQLDSLGVKAENVGNHLEPNRMHAPLVNSATVGNHQGTHSANRMHDPFDEAANVGRGTQSAFIVVAFSEFSRGFNPDSSSKAGTCSRRRQRPLDAPNSTPIGYSLHSLCF